MCNSCHNRSDLKVHQGTVVPSCVPSAHLDQRIALVAVTARFLPCAVCPALSHGWDPTQPFLGIPNTTVPPLVPQAKLTKEHTQIKKRGSKEYSNKKRIQSSPNWHPQVIQHERLHDSDDEDGCSDFGHMLKILQSFG
jgi:hypothetical protein